VVPSADQNPRLRFWHWWSFNANDWGQVQISTNNGISWEELSPGYSTTSAELWTRPSLDLTAYAGKTVRIGFYFESHNTGWPNYYTYVSSGWDVDELGVETGNYVILNPEGFEGGWGDWVADFGVWEIGVPTSGPPTNGNGQRAFEGTNCAATILAGDYPEDRSSRLRSPAFTVPPRVCNPRLRFQHWWSFNNNDWGQVQITTNNGALWEPLSPVISGTSGNWTRPLYDLKPYSGLTVRIGFYFQSQNSGWPNYYTYVSSGWYIDDIRLTHDFAALLSGSPIIRTQSIDCVSLDIAASTPPTVISFTLQAPAGNLANPTLTPEGCWTGDITPLSSSLWAVALTNNCSTTPMGVATVGSICFSAVSAQSAFVPLTIADLVGPPTPRYAFGSRAVTIANEPLLEPWLGANQRRMATLFGITGTSYDVLQTLSLSPTSWSTGWTHVVPNTLYTNFAITGSGSNAPTLFLRAAEQQPPAITIGDQRP